MKNFNLIKRLFMDSHEKQSPQRFGRYAAMLIMLLTLGVGQMWAAVTLYYQKDMPSGNYSASNSASMTQSSVNSNRYSCSVSLQNGSYGFYIKNGNDFYKVSATATTNESVLLYNYGSTNYGNSNHRVTYNTGAAGYFIFTFDASNNKVCVSKRDGLTIKVAWSTASGHDSDWNLCTYTTLSEEGSTGKYSADVDLTAVKHYMFVQTDNTRYWRGSSTLSVNNSTSLSYYGNSNYGGSGDKVNFTPSVAGKYRFTWNHADKTIKLQRLYNISYQKGDYGTGSTQTDYKVHGTNITLRSSGDFSRTGYNHTAWNTNANGTSGTSYSLGATYSTNSNLTLYPTWTANTYTVAYNANDAQYPGTATGSTSSSSHTYGTAKALTSNGFSRAGYTFAGWNTEADGSGTSYTNGQSVTNLTSTDGATVTLYAKWTENKSTVTLVASPEGKGTFQVGGETVTSTQAGVTTTPSVTAYPISGYRFTGWSITGGASISSTSDNPTTVTGGGAGTAATLTATFEENSVYYDVTFGVGTSYTSYGSISATNNTTSSSISSGDDLLSASSVTFTASPNTGYEVAGFYSDASCTSSLQSGNTTTYTIASLSSAVTVYVKFVEKTWSVAFAAGTGGTVTTPAATPQTVGQVTGISIEATPSSGYTFNTWTITSGSGSFGSSATTNSNTFYPTSASTITASFNETMHTVTKTSCTGSSSVGIATAATVTCSNAPAGKKFDRWSISGTYSITSGSLTSRSISFTATTDVSITATYVDRTYKKVYFAKPSGWTNIYAYAYYSNNAEKRNAAYPGIRLDNNVTNTGTETVNCVTYYYYKYYTDNNGEGDDQTSNAALWNRVVFNDNNDSRKTADLTISNGHFYRSASTGSGSTQGYDWYLEGTFNSTSHWNIEDYPIVFDACGTTGSVEVEDLTATSQSFKIYRASTNEWFRYSTAAIPLNTVLTLINSSGDNNTFTPTATTSYRFTLDITSTSSPKLTVGPADDEDHTVTFAVNGHGKITTPGTGEKTIHRYAPTTITAVADPGYRFTGWTKTGTNNGHISIANASSATTTVTADADVSSATITANFSNDGFVYFDASAVSGFSGGGKVYVTYLKSNALSWDDGEGKTGALIVKNWISDDLHNKEMTRIPNTNIYYFYTATTPQGKILFTSKSHAGSDYKLWEMAAVVREDFNVGQDNMFVAENWVLKDKNKTGYYDGYWMKYNETDPGVQLCIYSMASSTPHISGSPFSFTRTEEGSRIYTTKVTGLTANTQYGIEIKGLNGTYYKNRGEMTSTNAVGGWDYVDREATRGTIRTTAAGDYDVQLSCSDKLILAVDFPLAVGDYQVKYSGKDSVGGTTITNASSVIRHIGAVGSKNDTVSFFVVKGDSWTLQLQKCTAVSPSITWANVSSAKTATDFGSPETGVYNFVVKQDSASGTPVTPSFATMTPIAYTGNYYIRTDAAAGGWEAYKKSMDNRMVFSNYSKQHSNYDHYHCHYSTSGKNVKFCIANDYSGQLSVEMTTDSYVNSYGNLYADANVRFMWNSETNVVRRAYLNGSSTTDFLVLAAKNDSVKNANGTAISKSGDYNQVKFEDKNNWVYQKEVQALEGTHYRLTSNYWYSGDDHIQYFKGSEGDWTPAHTELLIGGTTSSWQTLRLIYDFKTNHLTAAWLPPTTDITTAKQIEADMLLIRTCQNAAQQLTFTGSGSVADVKTMIGAIELRYDSIVGRVGNFDGDAIGGNRANRELMYYISFPFDVAVSDIYGFGQLNKEWYLQYYDGAERAAKGFFRGDGTTTFWKFMTLSDTLKANVGYSLLLDNDYFNVAGTGTVWEHMKSGDKIYLYFPSVKELDGSKVIKTGSATVTLDANEHTSGRTFEVNSRTLNHNFTDSHWNMMGVPLFENKSDMSASFAYADDPSAMPGDGKGYFYEWDSLSNELSIRDASTYTFKSMHGYMVQHSGTVTFTGSSIQQASIVARRALKNEENYVLELQLLQNNRRVSRTYIELRDEASDMFALNEDVYMVYTSLPADLFTYAGDYDVSANVLSVQDHTIPVGIEVHKAGAFTFTMPSNFSGTATLVDTETGDRTNLALSDYTVSLPKGVCDGRFYIEINTKKVPTAIDGVEDGSGSLKDGKAHKFIENGQMYILQNGVIYDAQGKRVK